MTGILVAVDGTPASLPALQTAALLERRLGWTIRALHVGSAPPHEAAEELGLTLDVLGGEPERELVAAASDAALVVVGQHRPPGGRALGRMVDVLRHAITAPLMVVPSNAPVRPTLDRVLFCLDGSTSVSTLARPAIVTFSAAGMQVGALHVFEPRTVPQFHDGAPDDEVWRAEFLALNCEGLDVDLRTSAGPLVPAVLRTARIQDTDIIVLASRPGTSARGESVIREVLLNADRPIALVSASPAALAALPGNGGTWGAYVYRELRSPSALLDPLTVGSPDPL